MQHLYLGQNRFFQAGLMTIGAPGDLSAFDRLRDLRAKMANHFQAGWFVSKNLFLGSMDGIFTYIYRKNQRNVAVFIHVFTRIHWSFGNCIILYPLCHAQVMMFFSWTWLDISGLVGCYRGFSNFNVCHASFDCLHTVTSISNGDLV